MKRANKDDLDKVAEYIVKNYWESENMNLMWKGIKESKAKRISESMIYYDLLFSNKYGDIYIYDDFAGVIVGLDLSNNTFFKKIPLLIKANKYLNNEMKTLTKEEKNILKSNMKELNEIHNNNWYKKYTKNKPYSIVQIVSNDTQKEIYKEMLEHILKSAKRKNSQVILETHNKQKVDFYKQLGFVLKEEKRARKIDIGEHRLIKEI